MTLEEQMAALFVEEANELLADFEQALLLLESLPDDDELLGRVFRCAHTLKGNSKILGYERVAAFTHELENLLDRLRKGDLMVTQSVADTLLACLDVTKALICEVGGGPGHEPKAYESALQRVRALVGDLDAELELKEEPQFAFELPTPEQVMVEEAILQRQSLRAKEERSEAEPRPVQVQQAASPQAVLTPQAAENAAAPQLAERAAKPVRDSAPQAVADATQQVAASRERKGGEAETASSVRVPVDKLDRLINLTGEVVIAQSMIAQLVQDLTPERVAMLQEVVAQMDRHCRELQERMLSARMVPIKSVFSRFNRIVRDLAGSTGKSIHLELSGEETELDKNVIEKISDPLTHLVRNAIDHGVEPAEQRRAAGKPEQATVTLAAYQKSGNIFIDVSDDGRGLDAEKILHKAIRVGLTPSDAGLSVDEIHSLIFHPGFSTADQVTDISGRGVGMDVVKRNVQALKGSITILTERGKGTTFRIKMPLTLAILDGLGLRVGDQTYLVPLVSVVESLRPNRSDVRIINGVGEVVDVRGEYVPLIRLHRVFKIEGALEAAHEGLIMVIDDGARKLALLIDELIGQFQVVVKSLETNFQSVPGIAGGTILGDGRVALILDTGNLASVAAATLRTRRPLGLAS